MKIVLRPLLHKIIWIFDAASFFIKFIDRKNVIVNTFRMQAYDSIMCGYFCIRFIDFMFKGKTLTEFTNLFSPNKFKKNEYIILSYFKDE